MTKREKRAEDVQADDIPSLGDQLIEGLGALLEGVRSGEPLVSQFTVRTVGREGAAPKRGARSKEAARHAGQE